MPQTPPERPWDVLDEAALLWTPGIAERVLATHLEAGLGSCTGCPPGTPWPCVMVAVARRVRPVGPIDPPPVVPEVRPRPSLAVSRPGVNGPAGARRPGPVRRRRA